MLGSGPQAMSVLLHDGNDERDERAAEREGRKQHECSCQREQPRGPGIEASRRLMKLMYLRSRRARQAVPRWAGS